jgi:phosphoglycerate dehydrogenase-like enzyme
VTRVWLPEPAEKMGGLPDGMVADVWTGGEQLPDSADEVEVIVLPFGVPGHVLARITRLPSLRLIQLMSAGAEKIIPYIPPGVTLCNARGAHDPAVSEWTVGVIIAQLRGFPRFLDAQREGRWEPAPSPPIAGSRVLIVGYGSIGAAVERRLTGFDVTIERVARHARPGVLGTEELPAALPRADVVIVLVPVTPETSSMVDAKFLAAMKGGALLVNASRGVIVDTGALLAELRAGRIRAALDVTDPEPLPEGHPLWSAPGLLLTPHISGGDQTRAYAVVRANLARYAAGEPLENIVGDRGY